MKLHNDQEAFHDLIALTATMIGIPEAAVKRDYFIVMMLQKLAKSVYADRCVFKGGTSLSKCYPGSFIGACHREGNRLYHDGIDSSLDLIDFISQDFNEMNGMCKLQRLGRKDGADG